LSHFGDRLRKLRRGRGLSLKVVADAIGTFKGYVCGIEGGKVNPPSVKIIKKIAKLFGQDVRPLVRLAWVDKAPSILRADAEQFLKWIQQRRRAPKTNPRSRVRLEDQVSAEARLLLKEVGEAGLPVQELAALTPSREAT